MPALEKGPKNKNPTLHKLHNFYISNSQNEKFQTKHIDLMLCLSKQPI